MTSRSYDEVLRGLSQASVERHFEAFVDIAWDDPAMAIDANDERWILSDVDPLGAHPWYRALPRERQIEIGLARQVNICKVGSQFESVLMRGVLEYLSTLPNGSPEFRYLTHEITEETHHTQMFQEFVNRSGVDVQGAPAWFRLTQSLLPVVGRILPELFFLGILAGEEPIDHVQKKVLRSGSEMHPLLERIMQIHIAEEARHISFAHEYIKDQAPQLPLPRRALLAVAFPVVMRVLCDVIIVPTPEFRRRYGIPDEVIREIYWDAAESRKVLRDLFGDVRMLAEDAGLMSSLARPLWRVLGIAGRPSRYRGQPAPEAA